MRRRPVQLLLATAGFLVSLAALRAPELTAWLIGAGLATLVLELTAPFLPGVGFFSLGAAAYLSAALRPEVGPAIAALLAGTALLMRSMLRGSRQAALRLDEWLADAVPAGLTLGLFSIVSPPAAGSLVLVLCVYALTLMLTGLSLAGRGNRRVLSVRQIQTLLSVAAITALTLGPDSPAVILIALAFGCLPPALGPRLSLLYHTASLVERERATARRGMDSMAERLDSLREEQRGRAAELEIFRRFASAFAQAPDLRSILNLLSQEARRIERQANVSVYVLTADRMSRFGSDAGEASLASEQWRQTILGDCLGSQGPVWKASGRPGPPGGGEPSSGHGLAFPLGERGVLYLCWHAKPDLSTEQLRILLALVELGAIGLETAGRLEALRDDLAYHSSGHTQARAQVESFDVLLAGVRSLAGRFSSAQVLETFQELALKLVQHQRGAILLKQTGQSLVWPGPDQPDFTAVRALGKAALERRDALILSASECPVPPWPDLRAVLACPVMADDKALGVIVIGRDGPDFEPSEQEALGLAAVQTAILLENCRLYEEVVESKANLEASQAQLVRSSKMAAIGQLAAGVAHELNTPLGAIRLRLETARRNLSKGQVEPADRKLQAAGEALQSASAIVSKLLSYSHAEPRQHVPVQIEQVVATALSLAESQLSHQSVQVIVETVPAVVLGQLNELAQVVINLLLNARDAVLSAAAEGTIRVSVQLSETGVRLQVEDSGPGIPQEIRSRIFDPFFTTKPVGSGTGLGLWVSHEIVEAHGGKLSVSDGTPTRFWLDLPRAG